MMIDSNQPQFILPEQQAPQQQPNQPEEVIVSRACVFFVFFFISTEQNGILHKLIFSVLQLREE
jgi:hypothetical protein